MREGGSTMEDMREGGSTMEDMREGSSMMEDMREGGSMMEDMREGGGHRPWSWCSARARSSSTCSSRVGQCDAIGTGYSTRLEGDAFGPAHKVREARVHRRGRGVGPQRPPGEELKDDQSRVGQCDAIGNGYSIRAHCMLFTCPFGDRSTASWPSSLGTRLHDSPPSLLSSCRYLPGW